MKDLVARNTTFRKRTHSTLSYADIEMRVYSFCLFYLLIYFILTTIQTLCNIMPLEEKADKIRDRQILTGVSIRTTVVGKSENICPVFLSSAKVILGGFCL